RLAVVSCERRRNRVSYRINKLTVKRTDADGRMIFTSQESRDQTRNLEIAREKVRRLLAAALREPRVRRATRPSTAARERRIEGKKQRGSLKRSRGRPEPE